MYKSKRLGLFCFDIHPKREDETEEEFEERYRWSDNSTYESELKYLAEMGMTEEEYLAQRDRVQN